MSKRLLFVHFTPPGVVGGVERILEEQGVLLEQRGYQVSFAAGRPGAGPFDIHVIPALDAAGEPGMTIERELEAGTVSAAFVQAREDILHHLRPLAAAADVVVAHNAFTLHFSLPLTAALWTIAGERRPGSIIAWCHDLAWTNPLYLPAMHKGYPWDLLRRPAPNTTYVTVSRERASELEALWGDARQEIRVIPNGIDVAAFLRLSPRTLEIVRRYRLFDRDAVLLLPVRITRRKNIEAALPAIRVLKDRDLDVLFLISGPTAPHHPGRSRAYLDELKALRAELGLEREVVFLADDLDERLDDRTVAELYAVSDVLLFLSGQEGFGLPILEAGLVRMPQIVSDIPILREVGGSAVSPVAASSPPDTIAGEILRCLTMPQVQMFRRVLREHRWEALIDREIVPLLDAAGKD